MSKWSRLFKPFASLFGSSDTRRGSSSDRQVSQPSEPKLPVPKSGVGKLVARATDRFRVAVAPPIQEEEPFVSEPRESSFDAQTQEGFDAVEMLGRDASYDEDQWRRVQESQIRVVSSSNVYSYAWEWEGGVSERGILYVTFLYWEPGMKQQERQGPGPTYAYYDFPRQRFEEFNAASEESAGKAVWDFCRIRGSRHAHQHRYRLVSVSGKYVPRKVTQRGFKRRTLVRAGMQPSKRRMLSQVALLTAGKRTMNELDNHQLPLSFTRSQLADENFGGVDRGEPNRGRPNRGR